jgi:hypothetical protein
LTREAQFFFIYAHSKDFVCSTPHIFAKSPQRTYRNMRSSTLLIGAIVAPLAAVASLLAPASASSVVTNKGVMYEMSRLDEIKAFDNTVDNGEYPQTATYQVNAGFSCIFYTRVSSSRG